MEGASTREIAQAAEVNHALIKYHFGSKLDLWKLAVDCLFRQLEAMSEDAAEVEDVAEKFRIYIRRYVYFCAEYPEHARIMVQEGVSDNERLRWMAKRHIFATKSVSVQTLEMLFDAGYLPRASVVSLRYILNAACQSIFMLAAEVDMVYGITSDHQNQIEAHIDAVTKVFFRE